MEGATPPLFTWMLRKLIRGIDACVRRGIGVVEFEHGEDALLRIGAARAEREVRLSDGTWLRPGDPLLELHLWNEHLLILPSGGRTLRWAASTRHRVTRSLHRLATHLQRTPNLREVKAFRIKPAFAGRNLARDLNWIAAKHGFEIVADRGKRAPPASGAYRWLDSLWVWLLTWAFNPRSLRRRRFWRTRQEFWISRTRFIALYGEPREVASEAVRPRLQSIGARPRSG
jgi:hypothetical protein